MSIVDTVNYPELQWGCTYLLPEGLSAAWGARAILHHDLTIDIPFDRQQLWGDFQVTRVQLQEWLNGYALEELQRHLYRARAEDGVTYQSINKMYPQAWVWEDNVGIVFGDCNESFGYMYLAAFMCNHRGQGAHRLLKEWKRLDALKKETGGTK